MLIINKRKHGICFRTIWYATQPIKKAGINSYRQALFNHGNQVHVFSTLITDLMVSEEEITSQYSKNCRYYVKRASKEGVTCRIKLGNELNVKDMEEFVEFFKQFWMSKGINFDKTQQESLRNEMQMYLENHALAISTAVIGEEKVVFHTYVTDGLGVRLWHSASLYREQDKEFSNLVGMANRFLHQQDMFEFKKKGVEFYDWGGAGKTEDVIRITEFKESFGGYPKDFYHFEEIRGLFPKLFKVLARLLGKAA